MMAKAQQRVKQLDETRASSISWIIHDLNGNDELFINESSVDAIISTLVIEHIASLDQFFQTIFRILKKTDESWVFITAMHPNMYRAGSQAGFIDTTTGQKLCGVSFDHSIQDIVQAAAKVNLVITKYLEKGVNSEEHANQLGSRAKKWIGTNIHVSFLFKLRTK